MLAQALQSACYQGSPGTSQLACDGQVATWLSPNQALPTALEEEGHAHPTHATLGKPHTEQLLAMAQKTRKLQEDILLRWHSRAGACLCLVVDTSHLRISSGRLLTKATFAMPGVVQQVTEETSKKEGREILAAD